MRDTRVYLIEGTITLADGSTSHFSLGGDGEWQQWGASTSRLGESVEVLEALAAGLAESEIEFQDEDL